MFSLDGDRGRSLASASASANARLEVYTEGAINLCDVLLANDIQTIHQSKLDPNV